MIRRALAVLLAAVACVDPLTTNSTSTPAWGVEDTKGYARAVANEPPDVVYGWGLAARTMLDAGTSAWRLDTCSFVERERPKREVSAIEKVGTTGVRDGGPVEVLKSLWRPAAITSLHTRTP